MKKTIIQYVQQHEQDVTLSIILYWANVWFALDDGFQYLQPFLRNTITFFFLYFLIRCFMKKVPQCLPVYILGVLTVFKIIQLLPIYQLLSLQDSSFLSIYFEPYFHILDIPNYCIICICICILTHIQKKMKLYLI